MILLTVILFLVLIVLMIIQTALFVTDALLSKSRNKEVQLLHQQLVTLQKQMEAAQAQYYSDVNNLRALNNSLTETINNRNSIIRHQDMLIKAYKLKIENEGFKQSLDKEGKPNNDAQEGL